MSKNEMITVENVNHPGHTERVNAEKYREMRKVLLKILPKKTPGLTQAEMISTMQPHLPQEIWPGGAKAAWWMKTVQLDLEAKGLVLRTDTKPLQWYQA